MKSRKKHRIFLRFGGRKEGREGEGREGRKEGKKEGEGKEEGRKKEREKWRRGREKEGNEIAAAKPKIFL